MVTNISIATGSSVSFVSSPPTVATFLTLFSFNKSKSFTITINVFEIDSPAGTLTSSQVTISLFSEIFAPSAESCFSIVPIGTTSLIVVFPSISPVLVTVIVYFISSPSLAISTFCPSLIISLAFWLVIIAVSSSLLSSPLATATFLIVPVVGTSAISPFSVSINIFAFTVTVNLTETCSPAFTSTIHFTPRIFSPFSSFITLPSFSIELNVVFSGILSVTSIFSTSLFPVFFTVIVYVIFCPA